MSKSVVDEIVEFLQGKGKKPETPSDFMRLLISERELYDRLKFAGLTPTVEDVQAYFQVQTPEMASHVQVQRLRKIEEIVKVVTPTGVINGGFEQDFYMWEHLGCSIDTVVFFEGAKSCRFDNWMEYILQYFNDYELKLVRGISLQLRVQNVVNTVVATLNYSDGTSDQTDLTCSVINTWQPKSLTFNRDKKLKDLGMIYGLQNVGVCWVDDIKIII